MSRAVPCVIPLGILTGLAAVAVVSLTVFVHPLAEHPETPPRRLLRHPKGDGLIRMRAPFHLKGALQNALTSEQHKV